MVRQSAPVAKNHSVSATRIVSLLISVLDFSMEDRSSSHKYMKVHWDMRKFFSQSCGVNVDFTTCSHQWLLLSFIQSILSGDRLQQVTNINTKNINCSIACLLTNAHLRRLLFSFIRFNLLAALCFLFSIRSRTTRAATRLSIVNKTTCMFPRQSYPMLNANIYNNYNKYLPANLFLCVRRAIEPSSLSSGLLCSLFQCGAPQVTG